MKIFSSIGEFKTDKKVVATLGTFDGVHIGHQMIIKKLVDAAKELDAESLVLTFFPHPRMVLKQDHGIRLLNTLEEKQELLAHLGLDNLVVQKFDLDFANLTAEEFVKQVLVDTFNISKIIIGYDHRFGKNRTADIHDLKRFGAFYGFEVEEISAQEIDHVSISSTKIRTALEEGNIALANEFLGHAYHFSGKVIHGKKLGRTLGFPTANFEISESYKMIPQNGIYVVESEIEGEQVKGMMSIGINPTFVNHPHTIEVNFLDWSGDLYNKTLKVRILDRIRDEQKFNSLEELITCLKQDELATRAYFDRHVEKSTTTR
ncbi:bifunctional riboflavin kinase/FAD synthetase [Myroides odoratus]|uniref:Riboflavin biosynthesis protein n=1 Tax=Myroides odoratus TaxID=256 RepID=A0A378U302_MYROD|nr:bifunctional riboflavin kinase/FAD synthetase [Myroides odoratus]QQU03246.1 bifunctional riboflavin kinase/FAD synthetase [Myroides odoratus]STZ69496.1 Riboflavin biosynthesis protein ribF [Myroides odoratus]